MGQGDYLLATKTTEIAPGQALCVSLKGREILICHTSGGFFAIDNICSHAEARLSEGRLRGHRIFCPLHSAAFDVRDGSVLGRPATTPLRSHPVRVEGDEVLVAVTD